MMTAKQIVEQLAEEKTVEKIVDFFSSDKQLMADLAQEIYLILLTYNEEVLIGAYEKKQIQYLIIRIARNQFFSANSPFYKHYTKYNRFKNQLKNEKNYENKSL